MRTIQMTIDETLLAEVDRVIQDMKTNRSEFIRQALKLALWRHHIAKLEQQHEQGYARYPMPADEIEEWAGP